jgi:hypothetical protein
MGTDAEWAAKGRELADRLRRHAKERGDVHAKEIARLHTEMCAELRAEERAAATQTEGEPS